MKLPGCKANPTPTSGDARGRWLFSSDYCFPPLAGRYFVPSDSPSARAYRAEMTSSVFEDGEPSFGRKQRRRCAELDGQSSPSTVAGLVGTTPSQDCDTSGHAHGRCTSRRDRSRGRFKSSAVIPRVGL